MKKKKREIICAGLIVASLIGTISTSYAAEYTNSKSFSNVVLPESSANTSLASKVKSTGRSYGRAKITSYTNCSRVSVWFRTNVNGNYHYWLPYMKTLTGKSYVRVNYCDKDASYYKKGVGANLRAENADSAFNIWTDKVSGTVDFN